MGQLESAVKIRTRNTKITRAVLTALAFAVAGALNPQALARGVIRELTKKKGVRTVSTNSFYIARRRLLRQGLIEYRDGFFCITELGKKILETRINKSLPRPKRWDKKWRLLIFDIREEKKTLRNKIRHTLVSLGFERLQDSVWVFPYDCEDLITLMKSDFKIGKDLLYIIADEIENDGLLRQKFDL